MKTNCRTRIAARAVFFYLVMAFGINPLSNALLAQGKKAGQVEIATAASEQTTNEQKYVENQIIVKFISGIESTEVSAVKAELNATILRQFRSIGAELWELSGPSVEQATAQFGADSRIQYMEPNYKGYVLEYDPDDTRFDEQWALNNTGQTGGTADADIDAPEAWCIETGSDIIVGVIDTGVDYNHEDLSANMWINPGEIANNGVDDDANGYIDDVFGYDFVNDDGDPFDDNGHGTHVSGIIAAASNNGTGIAGVSWTAKIMAIKWIGANGFGDIADAISAVEYATMMGVDLTNNSWRTPGNVFSAALNDAIGLSNDAGILFVASAGNYGTDNDATPRYPSSHSWDNIISVAATDEDDQLTSFSNFGVTSVDLAAPGNNIISTLPGNDYGDLDGTSMAAPHVAGAISLIWSQDRALVHSAVKDMIVEAVDPIPALDGTILSGGRLNLANLWPDQTLQDITVLFGTRQWTSSGSITAAGEGTQFIALARTDVTFTAVDNIVLKPGFSSLEGSQFSAMVGCEAEDVSSTSRRIEPANIDFLKAAIPASDNVLSNTHENLEQFEALKPERYELMQNRPNPFNPSTTINYGLPEDSRVVLKIYDILGREVRTLVRAFATAGHHSVLWNGRNETGEEATSGIYIYRLEAIPQIGPQRPFIQTRKMLLAR